MCSFRKRRKAKKTTIQTPKLNSLVHDLPPPYHRGNIRTHIFSSVTALNHSDGDAALREQSETPNCIQNWGLSTFCFCLKIWSYCTKLPAECLYQRSTTLVHWREKILFRIAVIIFLMLKIIISKGTELGMPTSVNLSLIFPLASEWSSDHFDCSHAVICIMAPGKTSLTYCNLFRVFPFANFLLVTLNRWLSYSKFGCSTKKLSDILG